LSKSATGGKRPTLKDVAAVAKVDPSLVSRVVNDDRRLAIPEETRARVLAAIEEVGYRKNLVAHGLRTGRTGLIGYVVPDLSNPSYWPIINGARERARELGYTILVASQPDEPGSATAYRRLLDEGRVDGLLLASGIIGDEGTAEMFESSGGPVVVVNRRVPGAAAAVIPDDEAASRLAVSHLAELGHRNCAIVTGPPQLETTVRRREAFDEAMKEAGLPPALAVAAPGWTAADGRAVAPAVLDAGVSAVFATAGQVHVGLMTAAAAAGFAIPERLSVIALNDTPLNEFTTPPTTAIRMPLAQLGAAAVDLLLARLRGESEDVPEIVGDPPPELILRDSTTQSFD
jgi:LacI family transcriptional regulator